MNNKRAIPPPPPGVPPVAKKRFIADDAAPLEGMTKSELQAALKLGNQSLKELKDIAAQLERFPRISRNDQIDPFATMSDLVMKKYPQPQVFVCHRCDHARTSNMKAKFRGKEYICGSCFDHLTRCVIPYRDLPDHQRPKQCIHKTPKSIQKQYRS